MPQRWDRSVEINPIRILFGNPHPRASRHHGHLPRGKGKRRKKKIFSSLLATNRHFCRSKGRGGKEAGISDPNQITSGQSASSWVPGRMRPGEACVALSVRGDSGFFSDCSRTPSISSMMARSARPSWSALYGLPRGGTWTKAERPWLWYRDV